jgi:hypothetical protein
MKERVHIGRFRHPQVPAYAASPMLPAHAPWPKDSLKYPPRISLKRIFSSVAAAKSNAQKQRDFPQLLEGFSKVMTDCGERSLEIGSSAGRGTSVPVDHW